MDYVPRSRYVLNEIKGLHFSNPKDREYFRELALLEKSVAEGVRGFAAGMAVSAIRSQHPDAYESIFQEINPEGYARYLEQKKKEELRAKRQRADLESRLKVERLELKEWWLSAGGQE